MDSLPDAVFIIDVGHEEIAVKEARKLGIAVVAVVDTNCSPNEVDYPIPGNDDAMRAIQLYAEGIAEAVLDGKASIPDVPTGDGEFVELDEQGRPIAETARGRPRAKKAATKKKPRVSKAPAAAAAAPDAAGAPAPDAPPDAPAEAPETSAAPAETPADAAAEAAPAEEAAAPAPAASEKPDTSDDDTKDKGATPE
jgi:small subunit ribosomal protein S2